MVRHDHPGEQAESSLPSDGFEHLDELVLYGVVVEQRQVLKAGEGQEPNVAGILVSTSRLAVLVWHGAIVGIARAGSVLRAKTQFRGVRG